MTKRLAGVIGGTLFAVVVATCTDIPSGPNAPFALELRLPESPSVILGDALRDTLGQVVRLSAAAFDVKGDSITGAKISFHVVPVFDSLKDDSTPAYIDSTGPWLIAKSAPVYATRTFRIYAQVGSLQSQTVKLTVTRRPDTLIAADTALQLALSYKDTLPLGPEMAVRLRHTPDTSGEAIGDTAVPAYLVRYTITSPARSDSDTSYVMLSNGSRRSLWDTTDANGVASRRVRVRFNLFPFSKPHAPGKDSVYDTVTVEARATGQRGTAVPGSPHRFFLIIRAQVDTTKH